MGGFTGTPPPLGDPGLTPAPDVPPNNNFDPTQFFSSLVQAAQAANVPGATQSGTSDAQLEAYAKQLAALGDSLWAWVKKQAERGETEAIKCLVAAIACMEGLLAPGRDIVAAMSAQYVALFAADQNAHHPGQSAAGASSTATVAQAAFDGIMRPIGMLGGQGNPADAGVGQANAEFVLGSLVNLHLNTWVVDVLHKMTGLGIFEWFHAFEEAVEGAMNTRGMARLAMKPFLTTFMQQPLTRDLNAAYPIAVGPASSLVKAYLRGSLDAPTLTHKLSELGLGPDLAAQMLLDTQKYMSIETLVQLVNTGQWTEDEVLTYMGHQGYVVHDAAAEFYRVKDTLTRTIREEAAKTVVSQVQHRLIDAPTGESLIYGLGFIQEEVYAYMQWAALLAAPPALKASATPKPPKPGPHLEYAQVLKAYEAGLMDLGDVETYLDDRGYSDDDITTLVLLDFTAADQRSLVTAQRGARARVAAATATDAAAAATAKADAAKASAEQELAAAYSKLASFYGG